MKLTMDVKMILEIIDDVIKTSYVAQTDEDGNVCMFDHEMTADEAEFVAKSYQDLAKQIRLSLS